MTVFDLSAVNAKATPSFLDDAIAGLTGTPKTLASKYLYDAEGSRLFEKICSLPEYYVTRTETALLESVADEIATRLSADTALIEYGSGASTKTRLLFDAAPQITTYVPIDISEAALRQAADALEHDYPGVSVLPLLADFTAAPALPRDLRTRPLVGFFPGSTIGNFNPDEARALLARARETLGQNAQFLLGVDLAKPADTLVPAYDDAQGVTAAFNLNVLTRMNRELGADFDRDAFAHRAVWNEPENRIEMHLVSLRDQSVRIGDRTIAFSSGETIHTENSHKYRPQMVQSMAQAAGWTIEARWISEPLPFGLFLLVA